MAKSAKLEHADGLLGPILSQLGEMAKSVSEQLKSVTDNNERTTLIKKRSAIKNAIANLSAAN